MNRVRLIAAALAAVTALSLVACKKSGDDGKEAATTAADTAAVTDAATGEGATDPKYDVSDFSYSEGLKDDGFYDGVRALDIVTLPDYSAIAVPASEVEVADAEVQSSVSSLLADYETEDHITDRAVADGDTVNIDYVGSVDGVEFDGGSTQGHGTDVTIGVTSYIDDFLEQLIGHKPGETINVEVTFPDPYQNSDLAGKDALFVTTINYITEKTTPELTDAFVAENLTEKNGWKTAAEVETALREQLHEQKLTSFVRKWIVENSEAGEIPEPLVEHQKRAMLSYYTQYATSYGVSLEDIVTQQGYESVDDMVEKEKSSLESAAKELLVLQAVAEDAGLSVSAADVRSFLAENIGKDGELTDDLYDSYVERFGAQYLTQVTLNEKVYDLLANNAVVSEDAATDAATDAE